MSLPPTVADLIQRFSRNTDTYKSPDYNETRLRIEFLDPLFQSLGWDLANTAGYADAYKDVIHEDSLKIGGLGGGTKAPDYCFRIGGTRKFFLEAKKPSIDVKGDPSPAYQLRRYAWSAKLPISVLSDFEEFAIYDTRIKPNLNDKSSTARIFYCTYTQLPEKWDHIAAILSKDSVLKGSFDKFAESTRSKRGTAEVDHAFLQEIERWRDDLAANIALRNPTISERDLNVAVTKTIDRIVFLRICEDRGVELYAQLQLIAKTNDIYGELLKLFRRADEKYNSGLFHFSKEKDRPEEPDTLTPTLDIDDKTLRPILTSLYYPDCPYEFSVLPSDILGHVYEQFLGKVIRLTPGHRAKVEEKPEVRKAGGVYYTPTYIVSYIVQNTLGKLLGPPDIAPALPAVTPSSLSPKDAAKLKILDPACGSGSFLLGAYQFLLDWHLRYYASHNPEQLLKQNNPPIYQIAAKSTHLTGAPDGNPGPTPPGLPPTPTSNLAYRLTTAERKRILLNNIHGVDIDQNAVETTKLSLLLKVLEGESGESLANQMKLFRQRALPDLANNIKCGNSLIGSDFYHNGQLSLLNDEETKYRINAFNWDIEFKNIMKSGGFDCVIGNPPWGAEFTAQELAYLRSLYKRIVDRMVDSYIYFIDRASRITKSAAPIGFIVPSTLLNQVEARAARRLLLDRGIARLVNLGQGIFTRKVLNTSTIIISTPINGNDSLALSDLSQVPLEDRLNSLRSTPLVEWHSWRESVRSDPHNTFFTGDARHSTLLNRLGQSCQPLERIIEGEIQRGISPDIVAAHVLDNAQAATLRIEKTLLRPGVSGSQIKKYAPWKSDQQILYTTRETDLDRFPKAAAYLKKFKNQNSCPEVRDRKHPYWALHRPRDPSIFGCPKLIGITTSRYIEMVLDSNTGAFVTDAMYVLRAKPDYDNKLLMAIMHSRTFLFLYRVANQGESRVIPQIKASKLATLPTPDTRADDLRCKRLIRLVDAMLSLHQQLARAKTGCEQIKRQITATDNQIDALVYDLYQLTPEEIQLVENATAKPAAD